MKGKVAFCETKKDTAKISPKDTLSRVDMTFLGSSEYFKIYPEDFQTTAILNYFMDYTGTGGITSVAGASHLIAPNIYPLIDLHYSSNLNGVKYYFVVKPGGNPSNISLQFSGAKSTTITSNDLVINSKFGTWKFKKPDIYTVSVPSYTNLSITTTSVTGTSGWVNTGTDTYSINPGSYSSSWPLVIEFDQGKAAGLTTTNLKWSTFLGSGNDDNVNQVATDANRNLFAIGATFANLFPQASGATPYQPAFSGGTFSDGFVAKFDTSGILQWSTYVGGPGTDYLSGVSFTSGGNVNCVGVTNSSTLNVVKSSSTQYTSTAKGGYDGLIFQVGQNGNSNPWLTYLGGNQGDHFTSCQTDNNDNLFIVGNTNSTNLPLNTPSGAYFHNYNYAASTYSCDSCYTDGYIIKFNSSGQQSWSTYIGSSTSTISPSVYNDVPNDGLQYVALTDVSTPDVYVVGYSRGQNYPNLSTGTSTNYAYVGDVDAVVTHFSNTGVMIYSSYIGGFGSDEGHSIVSVHGRTYFTGMTTSTVPAVAGQYYTQGSNGGGRDVIFGVLDVNDALIHCTQIGGSNDDWGTDIILDKNNTIYIAGATISTNFPAPLSNPANTYNQALSGLLDNFIVALTRYNANPAWFTCHGGTMAETSGLTYDHATSICTDGNNKLFLGGRTRSTAAQNFPLDNGTGIPYYNGNLNGPTDGSITLFDLVPLTNIGIKENSFSHNDLKVFPNPTNHSLNIVLSENMINTSYRVMDAQGKTVENGKFYNQFNSILVSNLRDGIYFIEVYNDNGRYTAKFVKND